MAVRYRTKVQVLHDVLTAARSPQPKTRLRWQSRLGSTSFSHWMQFCLEHDLLTRSSRGLRATERAERVRTLLDELLTEGTRLDTTLRNLRSSLSAGVSARDVEAGTNPEFWRWIWKSMGPPRELPGPTRSPAEGLAVLPRWRSRTVDLGRGSPSAPEGPVARPRPVTVTRISRFDPSARTDPTEPHAR